MFEDMDWNKMLENSVSSVVRAAPQIYASTQGAKVVADSNRRAAEIGAQAQARGAEAVAQSQERAAQIAEANRRANIDAITAANNKAIGVVQPLIDQGASTQQPGLAYMQGVVAQDPYMLNPQQNIEMDDRLRIAKQNIDPSLRGSGRGQTAILNDVVNRGRAGMIAENVKRGDDAARTMTSTGTAMRTAGTGQVANITANQGGQIAGQNTGAANVQQNAATNTGNAQAGAATNTGDMQANATTATGAVQAGSLGDMASFFANAVKDTDRESRYRKYKDYQASGGY